MSAHPGEQHEFRTTCTRCGEPGTLFVALLGPDDVAVIAPRPGEDESYCAECGHLVAIHREGSCYTNVGGPSPEPCGCQNERAVRLGSVYAGLGFKP